MTLLRRFRVSKRTLCTLIPVSILLYIFRTDLMIAGRDFIYLIRPIWDTPPRIPEHLISHYYAPNIPFENLCAAHGWIPRTNGLPPPRVIDAFIFSIELDLLEIRLKELWSVVDKFIVVEANKTFTGKPKRLLFTENQNKFEWAKEKIHHFIVGGLESNPTKDFQNEARLRGYMTSFVHSVYPYEGDLIITSDIDEIPYAHTIQLLKSCQGYPTEIHLEMRNYMYSFEFPLTTTNWKPHVTIYKNNTFWYHHGRLKSSHRLADAGWHCSFCFRHLTDFVFKMTSYSHHDRVTKPRLLETSEIQRKICEGIDIFEMLPEDYTFKELISQMGQFKKSASTIGVPQYVVENSEKFKFLLPGGCIRND